MPGFFDFVKHRIGNLVFTEQILFDAPMGKSLRTAKILGLEETPI